MANHWNGDPEGVIPVTSGHAEDANVYNRAFLDRIHVEMRLIDAVKPDLTCTILGEKFSAPLMLPAFSHLDKLGRNGRRPMLEYAKAAKNLHLLNWVGMEPDEEFADIMKVGAKTVRIIKPFADHEKILSEMAFAKDAGAFAVGMDIDHVPGRDGNYDVVDGNVMGPVRFEDLKQYVEAAGLPFIVKGVLSVQDALKARDAGVAVIMVSHHHGRVPFGIAPLQILPRIEEAVAGSGITIFTDCAMDSGWDVYKALAMGAKAAGIGRAILPALLKDGSEGVEKVLRKMEQQLSEMMMYTGVKDTESFDPSVLYF